MQAVSQNSSPVIDFEQLAIAQRDDPELSKLWSTSNSLDRRDISLPVSGNLLTCDTSSGTLRPVVPVQFQHSVFDHLHSLLHLSIWATQSLKWLGTCGLELTNMFDGGLKHASSGSAQKFSGIRSHLCRPSLLLMHGLIWCTSTLLAHSLLPMDLHIYSPVLIGSRSGLKPFQSPISQQRWWLEPLLVAR